MAKKHKRLSMWSGLLSIACVSLAVVTTGTVVAENAVIKDYINGALGTRSYEMVNLDGSVDTTYYKSQFKNIDEVVKARNDLFEEIVEEGSVLMKNNGVLPLAKQSSVTLLGYGSYDPVYTSAGGGESYGSSAASIDLKTALERNFTVNPVMHAFYNDAGKIARTKRQGWSLSGYILAERDPDTFTDAAKQSFASYHDAAIVTFSRTAGEGADMDYKAVPSDRGGDGLHNMLELTQTEIKVLETAKSNFDKVIVLVNSDNPLSVDVLKKDDGVDAVLWIGSPGIYGMYGVSDILCGAANPSGGLTDTFAANPNSSPAMQNFGDFTFADATDEMKAHNGSKYVIYAEGIYVGYKYYETRYEDVVLKNGNASDSVGSTDGGTWNYDKEVSYTFGYGLSYTTFSQTLDSIKVDFAKGTAQAKVTVTNTGDVAGKARVQLWAQSPYTEYDKTNKVEKAAIQLLGYKKTDELAPKASKEVTVDMQLKYLASYDYKNKQTFILDDGDYYFAVGNGAHEALNNVLALKGKTVADGMTANGDTSAAKQVTNNKFTVYENSYNNKKVENIFEGMDINSEENLNKEFVNYLTRSDWKGTFPKTFTTVTTTDKMKKELSTDTYVPDASYTEPVTTESTKTNYKLLDLLDFKDNPYAAIWDEYLDQWSLQEMANLVVGVKNQDRIGLPEHNLADAGRGINGKWNTTATEKPYYTDPDKVKNDPYLKTNLCVYPSSCLQAACFSNEMMTKIGHMFAEDGLWANYCGLNLGFDFHRTPFFGRLNASYSEDSVLQCITGLYLVPAMQEKGLIAAPKHFAFNSQETNRQGVATFTNEQRARELELRSYEGAYCEGRAKWGMSSFPRMGCVAAPQCKALLIDFLRNEWGFMGWMETDMAQASYMYAASCIVNGSGKFAAFSDSWIKEVFEASKNNYELQAAARENARRRCYTIINSNAINGYSSNMKSVPVTPWWEAILFTAIAVSAAAVVACGVMYVLNARRKGE